MELDDLIKAFWGRLEIRIIDYGFSSLRNFCYSKGLNYQVIVAARRKLEFPRLEEIIKFTEYLDIDLNTLVYGAGFEEVEERIEERSRMKKSDLRRFRRIFETLQHSDSIRIAAVEIALGIYEEK